MLPKTHRLPAFEIQPLLRSGRRVSRPEIQLIYRLQINSGNQKEDSRNFIVHKRFAVVVSTKVDKRATVRNRIKRLIHESLQHLMLMMTKTIDGAFLVRKNIVKKRQQEVELIIKSLLLQASGIDE